MRKLFKGIKWRQGDETLCRLRLFISQKGKKEAEYDKGTQSLQCYGKGQYKVILKYFSQSKNYGMLKIILKYQA